jgi:hypothetical protein
MNWRFRPAGSASIQLKTDPKQSKQNNTKHTKTGPILDVIGIITAVASALSACCFQQRSIWAICLAAVRPVVSLRCFLSILRLHLIQTPTTSGTIIAATEDANVEAKHHQPGNSSLDTNPNGLAWLVPVKGIVDWTLLNLLVVTWDSFTNLQEVVDDRPNHKDRGEDQKTPAQILFVGDHGRLLMNKCTINTIKFWRCAQYDDTSTAYGSQSWLTTVQ